MKKIKLKAYTKKRKNLSPIKFLLSPISFTLNNTSNQTKDIIFVSTVHVEFMTILSFLAEKLILEFTI